MTDTSTGNVQLTQAVLQRRIGADTRPNEPNVLLIEGMAERGWVGELGRQGRARVDEAMKSAVIAWRSSESAAKVDRLARELTAAESAEGEARRVAARLEDELAARLDAGEDTAIVEENLAAAKSELARVAVRASVLRHLHDKAHSQARERLGQALEAARLEVHQEARQEHQAALRMLEQVVAEHFPAVNRSGYVFSLTKTADVCEHHLRLTGYEPTGESENRSTI
jgi:hypothetical protein